jgi:hypothetical protein
MYTRETLDKLYVELFSSKDGAFCGPLISSPPKTIGEDGYSLWGDSLKQVTFAHQSGSRSGESKIIVTCLPNTDNDAPLFAITHFHHEGSWSEVKTLDRIRLQLEELSASLFKEHERARNEPDLMDPSIIYKDSRDPCFKYNFAEILWNTSILLTILSIAEQYIGE